MPPAVWMPGVLRTLRVRRVDQTAGLTGIRLLLVLPTHLGLGLSESRSRSHCLTCRRRWPRWTWLGSTARRMTLELTLVSLAGQRWMLAGPSRLVRLGWPSRLVGPGLGQARRGSANLSLEVGLGWRSARTGRPGGITRCRRAGRGQIVRAAPAVRAGRAERAGRRAPMRPGRRIHQFCLQLPHQRTARSRTRRGGQRGPGGNVHTGTTGRPDAIVPRKDARRVRPRRRWRIRHRRQRAPGRISTQAG
jgi:hypothetical protein